MTKVVPPRPTFDFPGARLTFLLPAGFVEYRRGGPGQIPGRSEAFTTQHFASPDAPMATLAVSVLRANAADVAQLMPSSTPGTKNVDIAGRTFSQYSDGSAELLYSLSVFESGVVVSIASSGIPTDVVDQMAASLTIEHGA